MQIDGEVTDYDSSKEDENSEFENTLSSDEEVELEIMQKIVDDILVASLSTLQESRNEADATACGNDDVNDGNSDDDLVLHVKPTGI